MIYRTIWTFNTHPGSGRNNTDNFEEAKKQTRKITTTTNKQAKRNKK